MKSISKCFIALLLMILLAISVIMATPANVHAAVKQPKKLELNMKKAEVSAGCQVKLKVKSVQPKNASKQVVWNSSNKKIAQVSKTGVVKGKKAGTVTITATSKKNPKVVAKCKVKVYKSTKTVKLNSQRSYTLSQGGQVKLSAKVTNPKKGAQPIQWSSQNNKIAKVDTKGKVTAISSGTTNIIGTSGKKNVKVKITVKEKEQDNTNPSDDGWYVSNGTLYLSKIYYTVLNIAGNNCCLYEEPWVAYKNSNQIKRIEIDADMVYTTKSYITGKDYTNLATDISSFSGGEPLFGNMNALESVYIKRLNLDKIKDISYMFANDKNLTSIDISGLDVSGVTSTAFLFYGDSALTSINLQNWNTSNFTSIKSMFANCTNLKSVSLSLWDTRNVKNFSGAFNNCSSLSSINLANWTIYDADVSGMFFDCNSLSNVILSNVTLQNTIASNTMFNKNNSIASYSFANDWIIYTEKHKSIWPILDDCYSTDIYYDVSSNIFIEYIYYKKIVPGWYKESVEYQQSVDDCEPIYRSLKLDIYTNTENGKTSVNDVISACIDCLTATEAIDSDQSTLISNLLSKLNILAECKNGNFTLKDIVDLLEMSKEELEILKNEQSKIQ